MKILLECFIPVESGPVFSLGLAKGLIQNGVEVYVILHRDMENIQEWRKLLDDSHIFILKSNLSLKKQQIQTFKDFFNIWKKFSGIYFDFYIDTFPLHFWKISPFIKYAESMGIDHDVIPHSSASHNASSNVKKRIKKLDNVIVLSKLYIDLAKAKYKLDDNHVFYLRHGAMEYPKKHTIGKETTSKIRFLYFGRIDGYKGLNVLAKAYEMLSSKCQDVELIVAGSGDFSAYKDSFDKLNRCTVINRYITDDEISDLFGAPQTVVVLPYLDASQSGVIGMALNYKVPVIVSDTGGLREQLFGGEMGVFVSPGSSTDLFYKMKLFVEDENLYQKQKLLMEGGYKKSTWKECVNVFLCELERKKCLKK